MGCVACGLLGHLSTPLSLCLSFLVSKIGGEGAGKARWFSRALTRDFMAHLYKAATRWVPLRTFHVWLVQLICLEQQF